MTREAVNAADFRVGDPVVVTQPWYRRGRVFLIASIDERSATVRDGSTFVGVSVDDLRHAAGAELLVTPFDLTDERIVAYALRLPRQDSLQPESQARRDCLVATRCLDEAARFEAPWTSTSVSCEEPMEAYDISHGSRTE